MKRLNLKEMPWNRYGFDSYGSDGISGELTLIFMRFLKWVDLVKIQFDLQFNLWTSASK